MTWWEWLLVGWEWLLIGWEWLLIAWGAAAALAALAFSGACSVAKRRGWTSSRRGQASAPALRDDPVPMDGSGDGVDRPRQTTVPDRGTRWPARGRRLRL